MGLQVSGEKARYWQTNAKKLAEALHDGGPDAKGFKGMPEHQMGATTTQFVTVVTTASELEAALDEQAQHIEIQDHLDLTLWGWRNMTEWRAILEIPAFVLSIRVRLAFLSSGVCLVFSCSLLLCLRIQCYQDEAFRARLESAATFAGKLQETFPHSGFPRYSTLHTTIARPETSAVLNRA